jgi:hypothetical protein
LNALAEEMKQVRKRCRLRLEDALSSSPPEARVDLALHAADNYAREIVRNIDRIEAIQNDHPKAWGQSDFGMEEHRQQLMVQRMLVDAALIALGGRWPGSEG